MATSTPGIIGAVWHTLVSFLHFSEGRPVFVEAAWDYQNLQNII